MLAMSSSYILLTSTNSTTTNLVLLTVSSSTTDLQAWYQTTGRTNAFSNSVERIPSTPRVVETTLLAQGKNQMINFISTAITNNRIPASLSTFFIIDFPLCLELQRIAGSGFQPIIKNEALATDDIQLFMRAV